jgi:hypothetical protein
MPPISTGHVPYYYVQRIRHRAFFMAKEILSVPALRVFRPISWRDRRLEYHHALIRRMCANRPWNFATVEELSAPLAAINEIRRKRSGANDPKAVSADLGRRASPLTRVRSPATCRLNIIPLSLDRLNGIE